MVGAGQVEQRRARRDVFEAVLEAMTALREGEGEPANRARPGARPTCVRASARRRRTASSGVAVVCGAWHAPALRAAAARSRGRRPPARVCRRRRWRPRGFRGRTDRLSWRSGYGAGVESPGWYAHLWHTPRRPVTSWATRIAHLLRDEGLDASSANVIETVRLAEALAALRGLSTVGLSELRDAALTVLCGGDRDPAGTRPREARGRHRAG